MVKKYKFDPQLVIAEHLRGSDDHQLSNKQKLSLYKKSQQSGYSTDILEEVYRRGVDSWHENSGQTKEQCAFARINSFIAGGKAAELDRDLATKHETPTTEPQSKNKQDSSSRFLGTNSLVDILKKDTPGQTHGETASSVIKRIVREVHDR